jgi:hypothetical protein
VIWFLSLGLSIAVCFRLIEETTLPIVHLYSENGLVVSYQTANASEGALEVSMTGREALIVSRLMLPGRRAIVDPYVG